MTSPRLIAFHGGPLNGAQVDSIADPPGTDAGSYVLAADGSAYHWHVADPEPVEHVRPAAVEREREHVRPKARR